MYCLVIGCPHPYIGGGHKRTFEVLKYFSNFEVTPILCIPYSDLIFTIILEKIYKLGNFIHILKELEHFNVIVPDELYENLENISLNIQHHLDLFEKKDVSAMLLNFSKSIPKEFMAYKGLYIYTTSLYGEIKVVGIAAETGLDVDDAIQHHAALSINSEAIIPFWQALR